MRPEIQIETSVWAMRRPPVERPVISFVAEAFKRPPEVPAIAETLPGYETIGWYGVVAPKATPAALVQRLSQAIAKGLQSPDVKERLAADGSETVGSTPAEFDRHMASEVARFRKVIRDTGIKRE